MEKLREASAASLAAQGMDEGDFVWTGGCVHIYDNHMQQVDIQLVRNLYPY